MFVAIGHIRLEGGGFLIVPLLTFLLQRGLLYLGKHAGGLFPAHHANTGIGPHEHEAWIVGAPAHAVIASTEAATGNHGKLGNAGTGHGVDHLGAVFGDAFGLVFLAHHEAGDVLQEQQRNLSLIAQFDKVRAFLGRLGIKHSIVGKNAHRIAVDMGKAAHQGSAIAGLEFIQFRAVHDARNQFPCRHGLAGGGGNDAVKLVGIVSWRPHRLTVDLIGLVPVQVRDGATCQFQGVGFVVSQMVGHPGLFAVQVGAAQLFGGNHLPGGGLHQGRAGQEDGGLFLDHDHFVGHGRHVGAAGGAGAQYHTDLGNAAGGHVGHVEEDAAEVIPVRKHFVLTGQVGTAGIHQIDTGKPVFGSNGLGPQVFLHGQRVVAAAFYRGIVSDDHAFHAVDLTDAAHTARRRHVFPIDAFGGQGGNLQKRGARVQ